MPSISVQKTPCPPLIGSLFAPKFFLDEDFGLFPQQR
jgi:hypothetical protein